MRNRAPLEQNAFYPLPLGAIEPRGWLRKQLEVQAAGLTGHLDEFWPSLMPDSAWLGGNGEAWERGPYFLDGLLPLAYLLDDAALKAKANRWIEWTLAHQRPNGEIGPPQNNDWWPRMVMLKALTQYYEATGDPRVIPLMQRYFAYQLAELRRRPLEAWGKYRWQDNVASIVWLYNRTGDANLLDLARLLRKQGFDWKMDYEHFPYTTKTSRASLGLDNASNTDRAMAAHGVNNAMALKASPVAWLVSNNPADRQAIYQQIGELEKYHLLPNGMYSGDEHFAGDDPSQGVELCAVVESMFSWEQAIAILGDPRFADRLERITFNALPGTISDDMWSHQYDQQPNQIACTRAPRQWTSNGPDSNLFGLEPTFGCCTANMHQGWPKFTESLWMSPRDGGLAAIAYAPSHVSTQLADGSTISIEETTDYPFRDAIEFIIHTARHTQFPLVLRIPGWAPGAQLSLNHRIFKNITPGCTAPAFDGRIHVERHDAASGHCPGEFYTLQRTWREGDTVSLRLPMVPRITRWYRNSAAVERGPLLFSLAIGAKWEKLQQHAEHSADWQLTPKSDWNYALDLDPANAASHFKTIEFPVYKAPFSADHPAVELLTTGQQIPAWAVFENSAGPLPQSPVAATSPRTKLILIPYASAKLRITAFPVAAPALQSAKPTSSQ